jgi:pyruvate dehydrogenase (quinone)
MHLPTSNPGKIDRREFVQRGGLALISPVAWTTALSALAAPGPSETTGDHGPQPTSGPTKDRTTADILVETLIEWGVAFVFGIVGDGINPVVEALRARQDRIRYIGVRHEEAAAFMASGFAKLTGKLGACVGTTGPGGLHLVTGLYDAAFDGAPLLRSPAFPPTILSGSVTCRVSIQLL